MNKDIREKITDLDFSRMLLLVENYFDTNNSIDKFEYHQCIALKTEQGDKIYSFACDTVKELIDKSCDMLISEKISVVEKILCMWEGGFIDVPSHSFIKALCNLNDKNKETQILLRGAENTFLIKKISNII